MKDCDIAVVGGGLLGSAFAYGLTGSQPGGQCNGDRRVLLLDEGDDAIRTARGNFGLVWVQGKGRGMPAYARWSLQSSREWVAFAADLREETGVDTGHHRCGGFNLALDEAELAANVALLETLRSEAGEAGYEFEVMPRQRLLQFLPQIGPRVPGATYCPHDGHVNPLQLLRALQAGFQRRGGEYAPRRAVRRIAALPGGGFELFGAAGAAPLARAEKVVIAAGHGSPALGAPLGLRAPVVPVQGQVLVTERSATPLRYPTNYVRRTDEGTFMLGPSARDVGFDLDTETATLRDIARQCSRAFPFLRSLRVQRSWAALRIMTPDGFPVYEQSASHPGAFSFACHSGVTLAAVHARRVACWVLDGRIPTNYHCFGAERFDVQATHAAH